MAARLLTASLLGLGVAAFVAGCSSSTGAGSEVSSSSTEGPKVISYLEADYTAQGQLAKLGQQWASSTSPGITLGFIGPASASSCDPVFLGSGSSIGTAYDAGPFIDAATSTGTEMSLTFGGQNGPFLQQACTDVGGLTATLTKVAQTYPNVKQWMWDLEGGAESDQASLTRLATAVKAVTAQHSIPQWLVLPVEESGLLGGMTAVNTFVKAGVDFNVGIMCQAFQPVPANMTTACGNAAKATIGQLKQAIPDKSEAQLWQGLGLTLQIGSTQGAGNPPVTVADVKALREFAIQNNAGAIMNFALNEDFPEGAQAGVAGVPDQWFERPSGASDQTENWQNTKAAMGQ